MPGRPKDEVHYRKTQRQLGEVLVALKLALDAQKQNPTLPGTDMALQGLLAMKNGLMTRILEMEG